MKRPSLEQLTIDLEHHDNARISQKYDVNVQTVRRWRKETGIPAKPKWYEIHDLLGVRTDGEVAQTLGIRPNTVTVYRRRHGILPHKGGREAELQASFVQTLGSYQEYVNTPYGFIDILTENCIYECKHTLNTTDAHRAVGQLMLYSFAYPNRAKIIVCQKCSTPKIVRNAVESLGIEIVVHVAKE